MKPLIRSIALALLVLWAGATWGLLSNVSASEQRYREATEESLENRAAFYQLCQMVGWTNDKCEEMTR